ncbi:MAG: pilus assembly protein TadG-related protein [Negativicutes bacterium]|jgi:Flp pilus assembly protein TadG
MFKLLREQKGSVAVLTAVAVTALLGLAAITVDIGNLYLNKTQLANMADAAALAGARDLPEGEEQAMLAANNYAERNGKPGDTIVMAVNGDNTVINVTVRRQVPLIFAKVFNFMSSEVSATAKASNQVVTGVTGAVPFSVEKQNFIFNTPYILKEGGGAGSDGNYGGLGLGGTGANVYNYNIRYGYDGRLAVGQWVDTEPGNMSGPTSDGVRYRISLDPYATFDTVTHDSPRIIIVPIIDNLDVNGREPVQIVGFGAFFLESVGGSGNKNYVTGRFMRMYIVGEQGSATDYGVRNVRLIS